MIRDDFEADPAHATRNAAARPRHAAPVRSLLSLLVPPLCAICAEPCDPAEDACRRCVEEIRASRGGPLLIPGIDGAWAATAYEHTGRRLVAQLKFAGRLRLARVAARAIDEGTPAAPPVAALVPVPPDPLRHRMRGFDPADLIARELATQMSLPLSHCLFRSHGRRQVGRSRNERLTAGPRVAARATPPLSALLIDDVVTTGSTLGACAGALRAAGSHEVLALAFARA